MFRSREMRAVAATMALLAVCAAPSFADHHETKAAAKAESSAKGKTYKDDMLMWIGDAEDKLNQLAAAVPEESYTWRPAEGVRSTAEVFLHVAAANYGIPSAFGVKAPEGFNFQTYEQSMTKKADIQAALKASFAHAKNALQGASEGDLNKDVNLFGMMDTTVRGAYMMILSHAHEHLGQSIAYARSTGITPPWTAAVNAQIEEAAAKAKAAQAKAKDPHAGHNH